jgi:oxygen-independent coproporphyrinogen-3 oxidase
LGIGAGAHGKITNTEQQTITRTWKIKHPQHYLAFAGQPERQGGQAPVAREDLPFEFLMNHLRLREGFAESEFVETTGLALSALEPALSDCVAAEWLERRGGVIRCTDTGWNFLDNVLQRFLN